MSIIETAARIKPFGPSFWTEFGALNLKYNVVNFGVGFPNFPPAQFLLDGLAATCVQPMSNTIHQRGQKANSQEGEPPHLKELGLIPWSPQYTNSDGLPAFRQTLCDVYPLFPSASENVLITCGAAEMLHCIQQAYCDPGDEVILLEPFFDFFRSQVVISGGVPVGVPLIPGASGTCADEWQLDYTALEAAVSARTKMIIVNTPSNPLGKCYSQEELRWLGNFAVRHNLLIISDEVYERLAIDAEHISIASLSEEFANRTLVVGSIGKTFSVTGWKLGWGLGRAHLMAPCKLAHQCGPFSLHTAQQLVCAQTMNTEAARQYWRELKGSLEKNRTQIVKALNDAGLHPHCPSGGYFVICDISEALKKVSPHLLEEDRVGWPGARQSDDFAFARFLARVVRVGCIPVSAFYTDEHAHLGASYVRFCYAKTQDVLDAGCKRLVDYFAGDK